MTRMLAFAPRRAARTAGRLAALVRALAPAVLPALWQLEAQAQLSALDPAGSGGGAVLSAPSAVMSTGAVGPGLLGTPSGRTFRFTPRVSVTETLTDNVTLSSSDRRPDAITQLTAGVRMSSNGGRLRGFADYALTGIHYARGSAGRTTQNALSAKFTAEVIEKRGFVDVDASISQQAISAFGTQSVDPALANSNRTEVRTYRISPYFRGAIPRFATYDIRLARGATHVSGSSAGDVATTGASLLLAGTGSRVVNWTLNASHDEFDYADGSRRESDRVNVSVPISPTPELRVSLLGGRESNNFTTSEKRSYESYGARVNWTPTPRTVFVAERQKRYFGTSHALSLSHRMARSTLLLSDVKDIVNGTQVAGGFTGISPTLPPSLSLLTSATSVQRSQSLTYSYFGLRDTFTVLASRLRTERIDTSLTSAAGDLATFSGVRQQLLSATLSHRLTPLSNLSASVSQQRNSGDSPTSAAQASRLQSAFVTYSTRVNLRTAGSLSARHSRFEGSTNSYRESALIANLTVTF